MARRGYDLLLAARNGESLGDLAKKLSGGPGSKVEILATGLGDANGLERLERIVREDSRVAMLVSRGAGGQVCDRRRRRLRLS